MELDITVRVCEIVNKL